ncbi:hypothetical protein B0H15DRAFT_137920 [Mycena belliarum]|uniref:Uncharacterized protein n=1 Tax=Mycena belliarum TaxID=1033014 RepID=A0AAD6TPY3_9AGAR|nr:hypothetical protein B0H15DRAFT_137920 [Mycena belliae]
MRAHRGFAEAAANSPRAAATQSARRIERGRAASLVSRCVTLKLNSAPWKCRDTRAAVSSSEVDPLQRARAFLLGDSPPSSVPHGRLQAAARFGRDFLPGRVGHVRTRADREAHDSGEIRMWRAVRTLEVEWTYEKSCVPEFRFEVRVPIGQSCVAMIKARV